MGLFKKKDTTPRRMEADHSDAITKIQANARGKKVRVDEQKKADAAAKIQAIKRGQSGRAEAELLGEIATGQREAAERNEKRISVGFKQEDSTDDASSASGFADALQRCLGGGVALGSAMAGCLPGKLPCIPSDGSQSLPSGHDRKELSDKLTLQVTELFQLMDGNSDGVITKAEATVFWKKNWAKVNANAMFNEVDDDGNGTVSFSEWLDFWRNVIAQPSYDEEEVLEELENIKKGGSWVDWNDGRTT